MVGKPAAGLMPIRGHSNVQGVGTVGVVPNLKPEMASRLLDQLKVRVPANSGLDTFSCMEAAHRGEIDLAVLIGGNLYAANPDSRWATEALGRVGFTAYLSTTLNLGHVHGRGKSSLILPVRTRDEERQCTSQESMFNFVRLSLGGANPPADELPSEVEILSRMGRHLLSEDPVPWLKLRNHEEIRQLIARIVPSMQPMAQIDKGDEFTIAGRIRHDRQFSTENGKANLAVLDAPDGRPRIGCYNLLTMRSEGQFNTIVYEDKDIYRGVDHRQVIFMNQHDMTSTRLTEGDWVWVQSRIGRMRVEVATGEIRQGNTAMYYPEANAIVPGEVDPQSRTPSFKRIEVKIYPASGSQSIGLNESLAASA